MSLQSLSEKAGVAMARFRVLNRQLEIEALPSQSLLQAAEAAGQPWRRFCGASALCGTCAVIVIDGAPAEARPREAVFIEGWAKQEGFRLGCQLKLADCDVSVINCSDFDFDPDAISQAALLAKNQLSKETK
jgi:ferredoxin